MEKLMNQINSVCVYSASSTKIDPVYFTAAETLGRLLADHHIRLINGAGSIGLMRSVADAVLANGGEVTGVIPHFMVEQNWHHTGLTELVEVESMHERKQKMADLSDAVIALPGGCGTLEELLEIITASTVIYGKWRKRRRKLWNCFIQRLYGISPFVNLQLYDD